MSDSLSMQATFHIETAFWIESGGGRRWTALLALLIGLGACGSVGDTQQLLEPGVGDPGPRPQAFLNFPPEARDAPRPGANDASGFPRLLSETGAFRDVAELEPAAGLVPYDLQAPLWSDGAYKRRWVSLPELGGVRVSDEGPWQVPAGTVFVKHFEMQLDERQPDVRRRLETRLLVATRGGTAYGVTYKWNAEETDAELVAEGETEPLSILDSAGAARAQPYFYPGPPDCRTCHNANAGYILGWRTRQLNREFEYRREYPPINQLVALSGWGFLDRSFDNTQAALTPRLANLADENESLEQRVRSYWDGNCAMCHAGSEGSVTGWDARFVTPLELQGLDQAPQESGPQMPAQLIDPGNPRESYIFMRGATAEMPLRMPPLGRNLVDDRYVELLEQWIQSLE